jgi:hypothetical protein
MSAELVLDLATRITRLCDKAGVTDAERLAALRVTETLLQADAWFSVSSVPAQSPDLASAQAVA